MFLTYFLYILSGCGIIVSGSSFMIAIVACFIYIMESVTSEKRS